MLASTQEGVTLLRIGGVLTSAQTALSLTPGLTLQVKVVATGAPPVLQIVTPESPLATAAASTINQSLLAALPRQAPLPPLLANLGWLAQTKNGGASGLPPVVVETARNLFSTLSTPQDLSTGAGLSASLQRSGLFLEAHLAQTNIAALQTDFKAGLLRLREVLLTTEPTLSTPGKASQPNPAATIAPTQNPTPPQTGAPSAARAYAQAHTAPLTDSATSAPPPLRGAPLHAQSVVGPTLADPGLRAEPTIELLSQVQGGLARVQLSQLASLPGHDSGLSAWVLELPVRHAGETHVIQMHIESDAESSHPQQTGPEQKDWAITLALDIEGLGPLHIKVSLRDDKVSASFQAERGATAELLTQNLGELREQMSKQGLDVASLSCAAGCRTPANGRAPPPLLDIKI